MILKSLFFALFLSLLVLFPQRSSASEARAREAIAKANLQLVLSLEDYQSLRTLGSEILQLCPKETCMVIGIGRSPTPFIAYFQSLDSDPLMNGYAWNIPLSDFRYGVKYPRLTSEQENQFFNHFASYFPQPHDWRNRDLLILDFGISGESLLATTQYIEKYFQQNFISIKPPKIQPLLIASENAYHEKELHPQLNWLLTLSGENSLYSSLSQEKFDPYSEFGSYKISQPVQPRESHTPNPQYLTLVKLFQTLSQELPIPSISQVKRKRKQTYSLIQTQIPESFQKSVWIRDDRPLALDSAHLVKWFSPESQLSFFHTFIEDSEIAPYLCESFLYYKGDLVLPRLKESTPTLRSSYDFLNECILHKSQNARENALATLSDMAGYQNLYPLFEEGAAFILSRDIQAAQNTPLYRKELYEKEYILNALERYTGNRASELFATALRTEDDRYALMGQKWLIYYSFSLNIRSKGRETKAFLKSLLENQEPEIEQRMREAFLPKNKIWRSEPIFEEEDEIIDLTDKSDHYILRSLEYKIPEPEYKDEEIKKFVGKAKSILFKSKDNTMTRRSKPSVIHGPRKNSANRTRKAERDF